MSPELDPSQQRAVDLTCSAPFGIVTGPPGTGKTTCLRSALDRLDGSRTTYALAAPTGKAARRMKETTGRDAATIHRLLEFNPGMGGFQRGTHHPLDADVVLIDEASMVDVELAAALFRAIDPDRTRLILIGDADQLPSVGPGRLLGDLVDSGSVPVARLTTLHRSAQQSWIHRNAPLILTGEVPDLQRRHDFRFVDVEDAEQISSTVVTLIADDLPRELGRAADPQVLIPQRTGLAGIDAVNTALQQRVNPRGTDATGAPTPYLPRGKHELRPGDRVIQKKNDYKLGAAGIFNGEVGTLLEVDKTGATVQFPDHGPVRYTFEQTNALQLAYALTIHSAQGSEFPWVVVVCHSTHSYMLTRQLIYTAVTRARRGVVLVGNMKGLRTALSEKRPPKRNTALVERMAGTLEDVIV